MKNERAIFYIEARTRECDGTDLATSIQIIIPKGTTLGDAIELAKNKICAEVERYFAAEATEALFHLEDGFGDVTPPEHRMGELDVVRNIRRVGPENKSIPPDHSGTIVHLYEATKDAPPGDRCFEVEFGKSVIKVVTVYERDLVLVQACKP